MEKETMRRDRLSGVCGRENQEGLPRSFLTAFLVCALRTPPLVITTLDHCSGGAIDRPRGMAWGPRRFCKEGENRGNKH